MSAPFLQDADIAREIDRIFGRDRRARVAALYGRGDAGKLMARGQTWTVVPTSCELDLRAKMPPPEELGTAQTVFLIDWTEQPLPLDLACRFAAGRVFQIPQDARLASLFGARSADPALLGTGLAAVLLAGEGPELKKVSGLRVERLDAYRRFLEGFAGLSAADALDAPTLMAWCGSDGHGVALSRKSDADSTWARLRDELRGVAGELGGPLAESAWRAWEAGEGRALLQVAVLIEAQRRSDDPVAEGLLQARAEAVGTTWGPALLAARPALTDEVLAAALGTWAKAGGDLRSLLREAEALLPQVGFETSRQRSRWLPAGYDDRQMRLGVALEALAAKPGGAHHAPAVDSLAALEAHGLDRVLLDEAARRLRAMALRLGTWLVHRTRRADPPSAPVHQAALDLARVFAEEGGFVDWCRQQLRRTLPFSAELAAGVGAVLAAADGARKEDDAAFSKGLVRWVEAGKPAHDVLPIAHVTGRLGADLLAEHPKRKLLVVLMDGMSWATAVQLLHHPDLRGWDPILWRPKGHKGRATMPAVLAEVPSLTQVSRAAFFAGRSKASYGHEGTQKDADRWIANPALSRVVDGSLPPLVLKKDLMDGGSLAEGGASLIASDDRVVGVVVNAIDDALKAGTQTLSDYSTQAIKPLTGLLAAADLSNRVVLLASDHGHVPGDALRRHGQPLQGLGAGGARYRVLDEGEAPVEFERALPESCWSPKGSKRVAAIWDESVAHTVPHYGEHGGLSLAEVVAPALLLGSEFLADDAGEDDDSLRTRPLAEPAWWGMQLEATEPTAPPAAPKPAPRPAPKKKKDPRTLSLFPTAPEPAAVPAPASSPPDPWAGLADALRASAAFQANSAGREARVVEDVLRWVGVLASAEGGALSEQEFGRRAGVRSHRVAGSVAKMGLLNADGFAMVEHDRASRQVRLHRDRLVQMYGLTL